MTVGSLSISESLTETAIPPPPEAADAIPVGHIGDADDFGAVVAFLCSRQAGFITGAGLLVDGGAFPGLV